MTACLYLSPTSLLYTNAALKIKPSQAFDAKEAPGPSSTVLDVQSVPVDPHISLPCHTGEVFLEFPALTTGDTGTDFGSVALISPFVPITKPDWVCHGLGGHQLLFAVAEGGTGEWLLLPVPNCPQGGDSMGVTGTRVCVC